MPLGVLETFEKNCTFLLKGLLKGLEKVKGLIYSQDERCKAANLIVNTNQRSTNHVMNLIASQSDLFFNSGSSLADATAFSNHLPCLGLVARPARPWVAFRVP